LDKKGSFNSCLSLDHKINVTVDISVQSGQKEYKEVLKKNPMPYFYHPWWLNAAAGAEGWQCRTIYLDGFPFGLAVFAVQKRVWGSLIRKPYLTPHAGIMLFMNNKSPQKRLALAKKALQAIDATLPNSVHTRLSCSPGFKEGANMQWLGYRQEVKYFNEIDLTLSRKDLYTKLSSSTRKQVNRGRRQLLLEKEFNIESTYHLQRKAVSRRQGTFPVSMKRFTQMAMALEAKGVALGLGVKDKSGQCLGRGLFVIDQDKAYSICLAAERGGLGNVAGKLLTWEAIAIAQSMGCTRFHFGGSMIPGVYEFNTGFGAEAVPYYQFTKYKNRLWEALALFRKP